MADTPQEYRNVSEEDRRNARRFFERAKTVADSGSYDFAISLYLQGLAFDPDCVEAHQALREVSLKRKASGGKPLGLFEKAKTKTNTRDDRQNLVGFEKLLAHDPGETDYMVGMLQAAHRAGLTNTVLWLCPILMLANAQSKRPDKRKFLAVKDAYKDLKQWTKAIEACNFARQVDPEDMDLLEEAKNLAANETLAKGYDTAGSYRDMIKDKDGQQRLLEADKDILSRQAMDRHIREAEADLKSQPDDPGRINRLAEALLKTEDMENENRAIELLEDAYRRLGRYSFRQRLGQAKMDQMRRMVRSLKQALAASPDDESLKRDYEQLVHEQLELELSEYQQWSEQYPTDLALKYELAVRLMALKKYDEAIPLLQEAREDPKKKIDATIALGRAFLELGFAEEAIETLQGPIDDYPNQGDERSKEMFYLQGLGLEAKGAIDQAIARYSRVAQWEFKYKDVQQRIKALRARQQQQPPK